MSQALALQPPSPAAQERIRHIVEAATKVMARQGYANTSMKDIAREAGIAQGLIHYYFGAKEDLVLAVLKEACTQMLEDSRRSFREAAGDPLSRAWAALRAAQRRMVEQPEPFRLMLEMIPLSNNNEALRAQLKDLYASLCDETTEMVEELSELLPAPLPIPARDLAGLIVAAIDGIALRSLVDPQEETSALFQGFGFVLLSVVSSSYARADLPMPPLEQVMELLRDSSPGKVEPGPGADG
jgi:AcrR family transcriptional regulator